MKKNLFIHCLVIGIFMIFGAISANAQTNLLGKYKFEAKDSIDGSSDNYASLFEITIELKQKNRAFFTKTKSEIAEIEKKGAWSWNKSANLLTVTFPAAKNAQGETYQKVTMTFKLDGQDLKVVKVLPASVGKVGDVFTKI